MRWKWIKQTKILSCDNIHYMHISINTINIHNKEKLFSTISNLQTIQLIQNNFAEKQVVDPRHQTLQGQLVRMPETPLQIFLVRNVHLTQHYSDIIMSAVVSQITGVSIVCSTVCSGADQRKYHELQYQRSSNTENVFIWWRHHKGIFMGRTTIQYFQRKVE